LVPTALSPVPISNPPWSSKRSRHPPCRPDRSFTGMPPISGSATRVAELQSGAAVQAITAIEVGIDVRPFATTPWQL
jgi:hypothetical protein